MRRVGRWVLNLVLAAAGLAALVAAVWLIDTRVAQADTVLRNVELSGYSLGGLGSADLEAQLDLLETDVLAMPLVMRTSEVTFTASNAELGVGLDRMALADAAMDIGRTGDLRADFETWLRSFTDTERIEPQYTFDPAPLETWMAEHPEAVHEEPVEPEFTGAEGTLEVVAGVDGAYVTGAAATAAVAAAVTEGAVPVDVELSLTPLPPEVDADELVAGIEAAEALAARPLTVRVGDQVARLGRETVRRWIDSEIRDGEIHPVLERSRIQASLERILAHLQTEGTPPEYEIVDGEVVAEIGQPPLRCCGSNAADIVAEAVATDFRGALALPLVEAQSAESVLAEYGVVELVGEFTTNHACCQSRVQNIQRMADIVRGALILPGEQFSLNGYVGERTRDKGFVPAGTILFGRLVDTVGGGVSQFATTTFNAAFFAGMDFVEYQSHSIYISRYPYGREATVNWPNVDLVFENNTPYAVLIWTEYTGTSITVQLWSTKYYEVEQTGQSRGTAGRVCTRVTTFRERVDPEGRILEDSVFATYRPAEGLDCNGNPTPQPNV